MQMKPSIKPLLAACALLVSSAPAFPQGQRDFLTEDEAGQIRETQEPNERLAVYLKFARLRLELVKQTLAVEKAGRSRLVYSNLQDYAKIIEAIDAVIDDALARKIDLQKGVALVAERQKDFLAQLKGFSAAPAKDAYLYQFVLQDALETTQDSLEESQHDLRERAVRVIEEDVRDKKKIEATMSAVELDKRQAEQKQSEDKAKKTKAPTLRRKGETPKPDR